MRPGNQTPSKDVKNPTSRDVKAASAVRPPSKGLNNAGGQNVIPPIKSNGNGSGKGGSKPDRPTLVKPTRDAIGKGQSQADVRANPTVKSATKNPDIIKPVRSKDDRTLGGARPGEALIKPANGGDPHTLQGFQPGKLQPKNQQGGKGGNAQQSKNPNNRGDPQTVVGLQNRDVRGGNAPPRQRVVNNQQGVYNNKNIIQPVNCGHSFCGGRSNCAYAYDYCSPGNYGWSNCGYGYNNDCNDNWGFSFSVGYSGGGWGFGLGYSNYGYGNSWNVGVGYSNWYSDCNYYRPVYSACGPAYPYYGYSNWCAPVYYAQPYYCRPYYSLRYAYGCYAPRYACYSAYTYPAYSSYWWLYDTSDNNYAYSSSYSYSDGYGDGFSQGYETASEQSDSGPGTYEPTWLAGGNSAAATNSDVATTPSNGGTAPSNREPQAALPNDGWDLLMTGDAREARRAFDRECQNNPGDGLPQIGYAITAGLMERYDEAMIAMHRVLDEDPDAFSEVPRNDKIAEQIRIVLAHYRNVTRENPKESNALFMTAALRHLLGEDALAYFAIDKAIEAGDAEKSSSVLKGLIQRSLDAQPAAETPASAPSAIGPVPAEPVPAPSATAPRTEQQF